MKMNSTELAFRSLLYISSARSVLFICRWFAS